MLRSTKTLIFIFKFLGFQVNSVSHRKLLDLLTINKQNMYSLQSLFLFLSIEGCLYQRQENVTIYSLNYAQQERTERKMIFILQKQEIF